MNNSFSSLITGKRGTWFKLGNIREIFSEPTVLVKIGTEAQEYYVHPTLITHYSEYFHKALQPGRFVEGETKTITIDDIEPWILDAFLDSVYTQKLISTRDWYITYGAPKTYFEDTNIAVLYAFADRFQVPELRAYVIDLAVEYFNTDCAPHLATIIHAFKNLPDKSPFLRIIVDAHCASWNPVFDDTAEEALSKQLPHDFLTRVMRKFAGVTGKGEKLQASAYREQQEEEELGSGQPPSKIRKIGD